MSDSNLVAAQEKAIGKVITEASDVYGFDPGTLLTILLPILVEIVSNCVQKKGARATEDTFNSSEALAKFIIRKSVRDADKTLSKEAVSEITDGIYKSVSQDFRGVVDEVEHVATIADIWGA